MNDSNPPDNKTEEKPRLNQRKKPKNAQKTKKTPRKITERYLRNSGAFYLQRFTASSGHFKSVMSRKIKRSCHVHTDQDYEECLTFLDKVTADFLEQGLLDDDGYLRGMVTSLRRSGKSKKAIMAKLTQKRVPASDIETAIQNFDTENEQDSNEAEFFAALKFARKKRLGPYDERQKYDDNKALNVFARNGFNYNTARRVMNLDNDELYEAEHQTKY